MTTAASRPTPAHELSTPQASISTTPKADLNPQGLPIPRGTVTASLSFFSPPADGSKPHNYVEPLPGVPQRNFGDKWVDVPINDLRGQESKFTLDNNAFEVLSGVSSSEHDFLDDEQIKRVYYPEVEKLVLDHVPGAKRVLLFDHTIRRSTPGAKRAPVTRVHIDQTPSSAESRVRFHLPEEADTLLASRYRIINIWRPLNGPVMASPLAVADSATTADEDLVPIEHRYPDRNGETAAVRHNPNQKWYYWSGMKNEERLLLKCFDSDETVGQWGRVPHTAFVDPRTPEGAVGRESIEVRALVFG
ncbi:hypothetical protein P154DRAFT_516788 [Amniculicola lignicola CBS 123094]|uniref:7alpha-cephem-methoxylase P8 chain related protein n=1 Tax=Amniculicola lignicola CBS 123094 TaxID=1392246 RepID=A0A6A5X531_9PLEO|nr:hypothetical protein P154DRAFT_516788 [Amniculicola lignicola CBS 123094]